MRPEWPSRSIRRRRMAERTIVRARTLMDALPVRLFKKKSHKSHRMITRSSNIVEASREKRTNKNYCCDGIRCLHPSSRSELTTLVDTLNLLLRHFRLNSINHTWLFSTRTSSPWWVCNHWTYQLRFVFFVFEIEHITRFLTIAFTIILITQLSSCSST